MTIELKDTAELMSSPKYHERLKAEYQQLNIRINKLEIMLENYKAGTLTFKPACSYELLLEQLVYMKNYRRILEMRSEIEDINIYYMPRKSED